MGDFGISRVLQFTQDMAQTAVGTPLYVAPEVVKGVSYDDVAEEFVIKTNILGNYIVSDTELATGVVQQPVQTPLDDDWIPEGVEPNPNTGDVVWPAWLAALLPCAVVLLPHKK